MLLFPLDFTKLQYHHDICKNPCLLVGKILVLHTRKLNKVLLLKVWLSYFGLTCRRSCTEQSSGDPKASSNDSLVVAEMLKSFDFIFKVFRSNNYGIIVIDLSFKPNSNSS